MDDMHIPATVVEMLWAPQFTCPDGGSTSCYDCARKAIRAVLIKLAETATEQPAPTDGTLGFQGGHR